jgi:hypothetical protein
MLVEFFFKGPPKKNADQGQKRGQSEVQNSSADEKKIVARLFFWRMRVFFKKAWHFKNIFREFVAFLKISILYEDIFREIEAFFN